MLRLTQVVLAYVMIGAVVWGGGAVAYDDAGPIQYFIAQEDDGDFKENPEAMGALEKMGDSITNVISQFGGPLILLWNAFVNIVAWMNWPLFTLIRADAPPRIIVTLGGSLTAAFWTAFLALIATRA